MTARHFCLYRIWRGCRLLYVGRSIDGARRVRQHAKAKDWFTESDRITLEYFDSHEALAAAEATAIRNEDPVYNIAGKPRAERPHYSPVIVWTMSDIADCARVTRQCVYLWVQRIDFPAPFAQTPDRAGRVGMRVWLPHQVRRWLAMNGHPVAQG